jgi:hypothetical protein
MNNRILDWAFVELTGPATDVIFAPNKLPAIWDQYGQNFIVPDIPWSFYSTRELSTRFGELKKGQYYVKVGSTTSGTPGRCNGVMAYCHWSNEARIRYDECGREAKMAEGITEDRISFLTSMYVDMGTSSAISAFLAIQVHSLLMMISKHLGCYMVASLVSVALTKTPRAVQPVLIPA